METYRRAQPIGGPQLQLPPSVWDRATGCNYNLSGTHNGTLLLLQHTYNHRTPGPVERSRPNAEDFAAHRRTSEDSAGPRWGACRVLCAAGGCAAFFAGGANGNPPLPTAAATLSPSHPHLPAASNRRRHPLLSSLHPPPLPAAFTSLLADPPRVA